MSGEERVGRGQCVVCSAVAACSVQQAEWGRLLRGTACQGDHCASILASLAAATGLLLLSLSWQERAGGRGRRKGEGGRGHCRCWSPGIRHDVTPILHRFRPSTSCQPVLAASARAPVARLSRQRRGGRGGRGGRHGRGWPRASEKGHCLRPKSCPLLA